MTAIAGWVGAATPSSEPNCEALLARLRVYGSASPQLRSLGGATFGKSLAATIPEDEFDDGPLAGRTILLTADIRIDNRNELIATLGCDPVRSKSQSDSDLLFQAWLKWREGCLDLLVGDFAFAVWDDERRQLTLARDPTGQRPLFFARADSAIAFSTMPSGLLNCPSLKVQFAFPRLAATMIGLSHLEPDTLFEGIGRVLPGHVATWQDSEISQRPYWAPPQDELRLGRDEYVEAYRHHLDTAVGARLRRRSGALGSHLSAGYDSSAVAATAARLSQDDPPIAFTCAPRAGFDGPVPPGRLADESGIAAMAAQRNGMEHVIVRPKEGALANLRRHVRLYQDPAVNLVNMEWWTEIFREASRRGVSTMLVGVMGNLSLNASGLAVLPQWIRQGSLRQWLVQARGAAARPDIRWRGVLFNSFAPWLPSQINDRLQTRFRGIPPASEQSFFRDEWWSILPNDDAAKPQPGARYPDRVSAIRTLDFGLLRKGALADAGIDERDAMADRRLIDFSFQLSPEQLLDRGRYHPLARRALADRLPGELLDLRLRGLQGADWFERFDRVQAHEIVEELASCNPASDLLDIGRIRAAIDHWPANGTADPRTTVLYRMRLLIALATGAFIQEFAEDISG
jgi:asparagine synthase (glutamine-hydrolysing)